MANELAFTFCRKCGGKFIRQISVLSPTDNYQSNIEHTSHRNFFYRQSQAVGKWLEKTFSA
jgi:hypothetical protein